MKKTNIIKNKAIKIIILFLFLICINILMGLNTTYASTKTKAEIGGYIAEFAINFANQYGEETVYSTDWDQRSEAYHGRKTSGTALDMYGNPTGSFTNKYAVDCVGWVSMAIHNATGLNDPDVASGRFGFVAPPSSTFSNTSHFEEVNGNPQPGDILINEEHVMLYVGNNQMVHTWTVGGRAGTVNITSISECSYYKIARLTDQAVAEINDADLTTVFNGQGSITGEYHGNNGGSSGGGSNTPQFQYAGLAEGTFGAQVYDLDWILNKLTELLDWFIGITTYLIRAVFVGWASLIEGVASQVIEWTSGVETSVTVEKLVNNQVPALDVNFFNLETAGGQDIETDSVMYVVRENIAAWYYIIRNISIVGLLITLIYLGIRMALSTVAEQKAKYKDMLKNWVVSFIIVFFIHYVMIIILNLNEKFIELINVAFGGAEESLYDTVRNGSYAIQASIGTTSLVMYIMLVYLLVKFLIIYFKRFLTIAILTFMAPILGITYSIDKIKDNKSQSLSNWLKEYTFNVIIQSVHALLYSVMISLAFSVAGESIQGVILAAMLIAFVLKAEGLIKKIFGIKSGQLKDALNSPTTAVLAGGTIIKNFGKANIKAAKIVAKPVSAPINRFNQRVKTHKRMDKIDTVKKAIQDGKSTVKIGRRQYDISQIKNSQDPDDYHEIAEALVTKSEKDNKVEKDEFKKTIQETLNTIKGTAEAVVAVPMIFMEGEAGMAMAVKSVKSFNKGIDGGNSGSKYYTDKRRGVKNLVTAGVYGKVRTLKGKKKEGTKRISNNYKSAQNHAIQKMLERRINEEYDKLLKDVSINQDELERVYLGAMQTVEKKVVADITYTVQATLENTATVRVSNSGTTRKQKTSIDSKIDELARTATDIKYIQAQGKQIANREKGNIEIDGEKFKKNVEKDLIKMIAKEKGVRQKDVSKAEIDKKIKSMTTEEKKKIIKKAMNKSIELKEKEKLDKKKANMNLDNVKEIIETIAATSKASIDKEAYKKNFENLMKEEIKEKMGIEIDQITQTDIDNYISNLTNKELINKIRLAGVMEQSIIQDKNANKPEYKKLVEEIRKSNYNKLQMKGNS